MERQIEDTLRLSGDATGALVWRQACRELDTGLTVAVASCSEPTVARAIADFEAMRPGTSWTRLAIDPDEEVTEAATLGAEDRLLTAHAVLWATSVSAPMTARERHALALLDRAGAPASRAVVLVDLDLMDRISDDPTAELAQVHERLKAVVPEGWHIADDANIATWLASLDRHALTLERKREVAHHLLDDALARNRSSRAHVDQAVAELDALLAQEDQAIADARRAGDRAAAHTIAALRRRTEEVVVDLRAFLHAVEADVPAQVRAVADVDTVRRTLPHWLDHVVGRWMDTRLSDWRAQVLRDLTDVRVAAETMGDVVLLAPSIHPPPVRGEVNWYRRLGVTAAIGGGAAAMLFAGPLLIPGAIAVTGGLVWTALRREDKEKARQKLIDNARNALRGMGRGAEQVLRDQVTQYEERLARLGSDQAEEQRQERASPRAELEDRRRYHLARSERLDAVRDALERQVGALASEVV